MPALVLKLDGDGVWPDLAEKSGDLVHVKESWEITALPGGMESGDPSVAVRLNLPDGTIVLAETSLKLFLTAADAFKVKYGDPRFGKPPARRRPGE